MKIKLFATDLDGTLLTNDDNISEGNIKAIKDAVDAGVMVTFATGRMYSSAVKYAAQAGLDVPLITYNGALIKSTAGKIYFESCIEPAVVSAFVRYCAQKHWYVQVNSDDKLYFPEYLQRSISYEKSVGIEGKTIGWEALERKNRNVTKLLFVLENFANPDAPEKAINEDEIISEMMEKFAEKVTLVKSKKGLIEVINPGVSKASALDVLAKQMGITIDEVMAIGDADNDLPMLRAAGKSVAMGNAARHIQDVCDYVVNDNENDGVAEAIYRYVLKKSIYS
ncbi:Cof-type HAD-IIB family hydrolase [Pectinatus frisingensis]|uniref:Cof-type HAD-IIB family hydrolase n=1 Tax=Pectinatus frisingensis TaxID=865 RepID=UPI0018C612A5|nr:Cof-type HAD-IIB family hydrolase [Pectinatus frisingensis]